MVTLPFALQPYGDRQQKPFTVAGRVSRKRDELMLTFEVRGETALLVLPEKGARARRRDELWRGSCCECFWRETGTEPYLEANFSPSCDWNLYQFQGYRLGMTPAVLATWPKIEVKRGPDSFLLAAAIPLTGLIDARAELDLAVSCVLAHADGSTSYWALAHPAEQPDFHHPEAFLLHVPPLG